MPGTAYKPMVGMVLLACLAGGCTKGLEARTKPAAAHPEEPAVPAHISGTIAEYAMLVGGTDLAVQGYGLVAGLGTNGSREVPAYLKDYFSQLFRKSGALSARSGEGGLSSRVILGDPDTAVVDVYGVIPPGAPSGTRFDVFVTAAAETQTRSLDGGVLLMQAEMYLAVPESMVGRRSRVLAEAEGTVLVNPFLDPDNTDDLPKLRQGRIVGGGRSLGPRPIRLQLFRGDYQLCGLIQRRINERFGPRRVAVAKDDSTIDVSVPQQYGEDYEQFLRLLMHLPVRQAVGNWENKAREIAEAMESSAANHEELSLVWEAIGKQVVPTVRKFYGSASPSAAFYAARTGMRLGDADAVPVVVDFARKDGSSLQLVAIEELGRHSRTAKAVAALRELLDSDNQLVRIAAYESLVKVGDAARITRVPVKDQFDLDVVQCTGQPVIYVSQSLQQRIVLFGGDIPVHRPVFFKAPEEVVVISAAGAEDKLTAYRKVPGTSKYSDTFQVDPTVRALVELLGTLPRPAGKADVFGLGLTYGQVVSVLYKMCKTGDIPAEFRLQVLPEVGRIYRAAPIAGRPDMPGQ